MKKKVLAWFVAGMLAAGLIAGCGTTPQANDTPSTDTGTTDDAATTDGADATSGPTQVAATDAASFTEGVSAQGAWIIHSDADIDASGQTITVDGDFEHNGAQARKIALYTQDSDRNVTGMFTLTVDALIIKSPNTVISNMTVKGDVYVDADGFAFQIGSGGAASIDGNLYFATQEQLDAYNALDAGSKGDVTGETAVQAAP